MLQSSSGLSDIFYSAISGMCTSFWRRCISACVYAISSLLGRQNVACWWINNNIHDVVNTLYKKLMGIKNAYTLSIDWATNKKCKWHSLSHLNQCITQPNSHWKVSIISGPRVSQLSAYSGSFSGKKWVITHSAPLSIAVYLHQTRIDSVPSSKTNLTVIGTTPYPGRIYKIAWFIMIEEQPMGTFILALILNFIHYVY